MAISWTHHEAVRRHRSWRPADVQWSPANLVTQQLGSSSHGQKYVKVWYPQRKCSISNKTIVIFRRKTENDKNGSLQIFLPSTPWISWTNQALCSNLGDNFAAPSAVSPRDLDERWTATGETRKCLSRILVVHCVAKHSYLLPMWASYLKINRHMHMHIHTYVYTYPCAYKYIRIHIQYIYGYIKSNSLHYI